MSLLIVFLLGSLVGSALGVGLTACIFISRRRKGAVGTLQIIDSIDEAPYLFLSLDAEIESFAHDPTVVMNVIHKRASHK